MKNDILKHKLLLVLTEPLLDYYESEKTFTGKSFEYIESALNLKRRKLWEVASELLDNKEIAYYNVDFEGFIGQDKGLSSCSSKKYFYRNKERVRENIKFYVGIFIPVISLLIALFTIMSKLKDSNDRIDKFEKKIDMIQTVQKNKLKILIVKPCLTAGFSILSKVF